MSKYKLANNVLFKDELMTICPIAPGLLKPVQNSFGQKSFAIDRFPCYANCPHFSKEGNEVELKCQANNKFTLESDVKEEPVKKSKLSIN